MKFTQAIKMALKAITSNKMRSFLTMLGVIIGVFAVTVLITLGEGATKEVSSQIESLGTNLITISITGSRNRSVTVEELENIKGKPGIEEIAPMVGGNVTIKAGNKNMNASVEASTPAYAGIRNIQTQAGRFLVQNDLDMRFRVAIVGVEVADELFGHRDVVGETISINRTDFKIIGVQAEMGSSMGRSNDNRVIIPLTTAQRLLKTKDIRTFYATAESPETVDQAIGELERFLLRKFKEEDSYRIFNQSDLLDTISQTTATLTMMLGGIAGISLVVGGIGIMNIMLVSVTERTREIGIRKAIGAKRRDILSQFLVESVVISGLGGLLGVVLGFAATSLLSRAFGMSFTISPNVIWMATGFSVGVGVIFGLYPANKASKLRPIEALRHE